VNGADRRGGDRRGQVHSKVIALARGGGAMPPPWITCSPLRPLALLMFSGLYLFVLPYVGKWRGGRRIA
jgi:hypothetical protein